MAATLGRPVTPDELEYDKPGYNEDYEAFWRFSRGGA